MAKSTNSLPESAEELTGGSQPERRDPPVRKWRLGFASINFWKNTSDDGRSWISATLEISKPSREAGVAFDRQRLLLNLGDIAVLRRLLERVDEVTETSSDDRF